MFNRDRAIGELAAQQQGLVTRTQASARDFDSDRIQRRLDSGRWMQVHESVYRVHGASDSIEQRRLAALLAVGPPAAVSHRAAADMYGLWRSTPPITEITTTRLQSPELDGVMVHRLADLHERWVTQVAGVRCTTVARTLVDLGAVLAAGDVAKCLDRALGRSLVTIDAVEMARRAVARQGRRGAGVIRRVLAPHLGCEPVAGVFEARMSRLLATQGLPPAVPEYEVWSAGGEFVARVDFAYPELKLAIEVDGFAAHSTIDAFRRDRVRQNALVAAGWTVLRFTWTEVDQGSPVVGRTTREARHRLAA
jgi:hypothetical protein